MNWRVSISIAVAWITGTGLVYLGLWSIYPALSLIFAGVVILGNVIAYRPKASHDKG